MTMPRFCVDCSDNGAICDFCRFAAHNGPDALPPHMTSDSYCTKHKRAVWLTDGCDDFECWVGETMGWREEAPIDRARDTSCSY